MVAHHQRRPVGRVLRRRGARHGPAGDDLRHVPAARHQHPGTRDQRGAGAGASPGRRVRCSAARSPFSARGCCSRRSSISSKGWSAPSPTSCGPAAAGPRLAWRRRARRLLQRARRRRALGHRRAAAGAAVPPAADRRQHGGLRVRDCRRCTCSTSTRGCCRSTSVRRCGAASALVAMALFYGFFVVRSFGALLG